MLIIGFSLHRNNRVAQVAILVTGPPPLATRVVRLPLKSAIGGWPNHSLAQTKDITPNLNLCVFSSVQCIFILFQFWCFLYLKVLAPKAPIATQFQWIYLSLAIESKKQQGAVCDAISYLSFPLSISSTYKREMLFNILIYDCHTIRMT